MKLPCATHLVILVKSKRAAERVMENLTRWLGAKLKLEVNVKKSRVCRSWDVKFLGFRLGKRKGKVEVSAEAIADFKVEVKRLSGRSRGVSFKERLQQLNRYVIGWSNYFAIGLKYGVVLSWDQWIRRRLRMCLWKQWKRVKRRVRELVKLGCDLGRAIKAAMSRKSFWRLSRTYATQLGMTNEWLEELGLRSLRTVWINYHYPKEKEEKIESDPSATVIDLLGKHYRPSRWS